MPPSCGRRRRRGSSSRREPRPSCQWQVPLTLAVAVRQPLWPGNALRQHPQLRSRSWLRGLSCARAVYLRQRGRAAAPMACLPVRQVNRGAFAHAKPCAWQARARPRGVNQPHPPPPYGDQTTRKGTNARKARSRWLLYRFMFWLACWETRFVCCLALGVQGPGRHPRSGPPRFGNRDRGESGATLSHTPVCELCFVFERRGLLTLS